ncbi:methyltransferase TRM13-domain-containing protein [Jimgerdemannia flammicorona]|uniref:tRNA:m(4)X modification enzyme TRM13 n=1 Tax=Jimgerdemannia flammicorona TaxID=994334 RepID=A0A433QJG6_9FUNG|nr:methyltransferase TRM13-domain-containing protein [Jimgerdemannia flammicorona]
MVVTVPCSFQQYCRRQQRYRRCHLTISYPDEIPPGLRDAPVLCPHHARPGPGATEDPQRNPKQQHDRNAPNRRAKRENAKGEGGGDTEQGRYSDWGPNTDADADADRSYAEHEDNNAHRPHAHSCPAPSSIDVAEIPRSLLSMLQRMFMHDDAHITFPPPSYLSPHPSFPRVFSNPGRHRHKHLSQESSMLHNMHRLDMVPEESRGDHIIVEFGAGTARLSRHYQLCVLDNAAQQQKEDGNTSSTPPRLHFYLIDRQKFRSRRQTDYMLRRDGAASVRRFVGDVSECGDIAGLFHSTETVKDNDGDDSAQKNTDARHRTLTMLAKHFCGPATDAALTWLASSLSSAPTPITNINVCMATCCHALCDWDAYVNRGYMREMFGRFAKDRTSSSDDIDSGSDIDDEAQAAQLFKWVCRLSSWATLSFTASDDADMDPDAEGPHVLDLTTRAGRRLCGRLCKLLLDRGRAVFLERVLRSLCGPVEVEVVEYTRESGERGLIIGRWSNSGELDHGWRWASRGGDFGTSWRGVCPVAWGLSCVVMCPSKPIEARAHLHYWAPTGPRFAASVFVKEHHDWLNETSVPARSA